MKKENYRIRKVQVEIRGKIIEYDEYYVVDEDGQEIFDRNVELENDRRLYNIYKKQNNLLTNEEIKKIRKKYNLTQKDYALILGFGEVTVNRIERGSIQTEAIDSIMKLSANPFNMSFLLEQNKNNIDSKLYKKTFNKIKELKKYKKHAIADISVIDNNILNLKEESAIAIAENIINIYNTNVDKLVDDYNAVPEYITNLKLQKLLYFVQALCLLIFDKPAFKENIYAWDYGPVVDEVYQNYKNNKANEIKFTKEPKKISKGLINIIQEVINSYGAIEATKLIDFTHEEDPWKETKNNDIISCEKIKEYYKKIYIEN